MNFFLHTNYSQRPTVYPHMSPIERIGSYVIGMVQRCNADLLANSEERAMWQTPEAKATFGSEHCMMLCDQADSLRESLEAERETWKYRLEKLRICGTCIGYKEINHVTCVDCEGTGRVLAKLPVVEPVEQPNFLTSIARKFK